MWGGLLLGLFVGFFVGWVACAVLSYASTAERLEALERDAHPPLGQDNIYDRLENLERQVATLNRATPAVALLTAQDHAGR